jgi:hypothetical protein
VVDLLAEGLLGGHVAGGAHDHAHAGERFVGLGAALDLAGDAGDPEVDDADVVAAVVAALEEDVVGLEVAVDDAGGVRGGEGVGDLGGDLAGAGPREGFALEVAAQADAADELDDEEGAAAVEGAVVEGADDVRVIDGGGGHRLAGEAGGDLRDLGELAADDLEGDLFCGG